ncbi:hypothetical protein Psi02_57420 [Planotetraspora silvatica]|uniref:Uncharacterized protein n=1 Tax=Planotetraspora silvatica TaxID=234614 RepID=A0A8J3UNQ5_9ACTN|nr:hypothetical protein Psi02_57420 [Planotetraspora silvatica]
MIRLSQTAAASLAEISVGISSGQVVAGAWALAGTGTALAGTGTTAVDTSTRAMRGGNAVSRLDFFNILYLRTT